MAPVRVFDAGSHPPAGSNPPARGAPTPHRGHEMRRLCVSDAGSPPRTPHPGARRLRKMRVMVGRWLPFPRRCGTGARRPARLSVCRREAPRRPKARSPARGAATQISSGWAASAGSPRRVSIGAVSLPKFSSSTGPNEFIPYGENGVDRPLPTLASCVCVFRALVHIMASVHVSFSGLLKKRKSPSTSLRT